MENTEKNKGINTHIFEIEQKIIKIIEESGIPSMVLVYMLRDILRKTEATNNVILQKELQEIENQAKK